MRERIENDGKKKKDSERHLLVLRSIKLRIPSISEHIGQMCSYAQ